jgi:hypothetical protein
MISTMEPVARSWHIVYGIINSMDKETYTKREILTLLTETAKQEINFDTLREIEKITGRVSIITEAIRGEESRMIREGK